MRLPLEAVLEGRLVRRYQRFLADVETRGGGVLTVHCPDPGSMSGCATPGAAVRCSAQPSPRRRFPHTLEMIRAGRTWVGIHGARANDLVAAALAAGSIPALAGYTAVQREPRLPDGTRLDFRLTGHRRARRPAWLEVKSATLAHDRRARFPDSVTLRGRRHLETLSALRRRGERAALLFVVQRGDCDALEPADEIDPAYGQALREAARTGVEILAVRVRVTPRALVLEGALPVLL